MRARHTLATMTGRTLIAVAIAVALARSAGAGDAPIVSSQGAAQAPAGISEKQSPPSDAALEISRQPAKPAANPDSEELPADRAFREGAQRTSLDRNFHPADNDDGWRPYLGITIEYNTICYLGREEHGLEVVHVMPTGPAGAAGVIGPKSATMLGAAGALAGAFLGPVSMVTRPVLERAGHLGMGGDMIVAVNDLRVRTPEEFRNSIAHLKPHDTMYVTVVRPIISGGHRTLRIAIKLGGVTEAMAAPPAEPAPSLRFFF